jgi:alpha-ketoglutarate-dependent 2,4-dichlorophenoxyacetate dioxygenase
MNPLSHRFIRFCAKITGVNLGQPIDEPMQLAIERAMDMYAVCVLPGRHVEDEEVMAFSRLYGPLQVSTGFGLHEHGAGS